MAMVPAVCDVCGTVFSSGIEIGPNVRGVELLGNRAQCPQCGSVARIPDGLYDTVGSALRLVAGPKQTYADLQRLATILTRAKDEKLTVDRTAELVEREAPGFEGIADLLPKTRGELYAFVSVLLAALTIILTQCSGTDKDQPIGDINIQQIVSQSLTVVAPETVATTPKTEESAAPGEGEVGRNEPCPCGSGKKYKKCCGSN